MKKEELEDIFNGIDAVLACNDDDICRSDYPAHFVRELISKEKEKMLKEYVEKPQRDFNWIKPPIKAWIQGIAGFPVEVLIIGVNHENRTVIIKTGFQTIEVEPERLYPSEDECPCR